MKALAIDTSSNYLSLALLQDGEVFSYHQQALQTQASLIYAAITKILQDANLQVCDCDFIAFGKGPGSFTGVRIAASCTQGLALACNLPVVGISNLTALAKQAQERIFYQQDFKLNSSINLTSDKLLVLAAIDARMQEVYASWFLISKDEIINLTPDALLKPSEINFTHKPQEFVLIGDATSYVPEMPQTVQTKIIHNIDTQVNATAIGKLAVEIFAQQGGLDATQALPTYLRAGVS